MTTPTKFLSAVRIITYAYRDSGRIGEEVEPNSKQLANGLNRLNDLINLWQTQGLKLWLLFPTTVPLVAGQASYTFSPTGDVVMTKPLKVTQGYFLSITSEKTDLTPMSLGEWYRISRATTTGSINSYAVEKLDTQLKAHFHNTPNATAATGSVVLILQQQVTNFVSLTDDMNFPMEWAIALRWGLADDLTTGQPQEIVMRCEKRAIAFRTALEDWDVEDVSTTFSPDSRLVQPSSFQ